MDYKKHIAEKLASCGIDKEEIEAAIAVPPDNKMGDYALPCFKFAKVMRKSPVAIAEELKNTGGRRILWLQRSDVGIDPQNGRKNTALL